MQGVPEGAVPVAGSRTLEMHAHMLLSSSLAGPYVFMCWIQLSQMEYSAAKWASRSVAAGSQGISHSSMARIGSLKVLQSTQRFSVWICMSLSCCIFTKPQARQERFAGSQSFYWHLAWVCLHCDDVFFNGISTVISYSCSDSRSLLSRTLPFSLRGTAHAYAGVVRYLKDSSIA